MSFVRNPIFLIKFSLSALWIASGLVLAAPFEIKVHDELIADYQHSAYEVETNLFQAPSSQNLTTNVFQTRLEYGYGITEKSELGANVYLSNYNGVSYVNGGKLSHMYIPTHDEEGLWHYGVKNEINYIQDVLGTQTTYYELTPILAIQLQAWRLTINPSVDITLNKNSTVTFSPSAKVAYSLTAVTDIGIEYYADNVPNKSLYSLTQQPHTAYLVLDTKYQKTELNLGVGKGVTATSDNWVVKLIAAFHFN
ncbi:hypothetical protein [Polynucleobacter sp. UK-Kesae-W10]|uniref:hypothetical protein n=1 Tax=Polynucleobacter sp. UK-Kesae-W10 TaxID=1819738 RepID=UPI001C0D79C8|nr:hypothetical protein [Polynucleobacter sp. UK-Kesae-W10]MBU3576593.1 hypothetical protein [Polynucleobacter sp. UK-Kesae-W10]